MIRKPKKAAAMLLCCAIFAGALAGCSDNSTTRETTASTNADSEPSQEETESAESETSLLEESDMNLEPTRANYTVLAEKLKKLYQQDPDDETAALSYAQKLFELGDFDEAQQVVQPLLDKEDPSSEAIYLSAQIEYLYGNYEQAETLFDILKAKGDDYLPWAEYHLANIYYQTNQYQKVSTLSSAEDDSDVFTSMMSGFGNETPYQIEWNGQSEAVIPMTRIDPLPIVPVEINGQIIYCMLDTGASDTTIDETFADALGVVPLSSAMDAQGAADDTSTASYGRVDTLELGGVTIHSVPVVVSTIKHFSTFWNDEVPIGAVLGTGVLKEFLPTIDYLSGNLVLRPRNAQGKEALETELTQASLVETMPFVLTGDHFMYGKGSINGKDNMNFFLDSGLPVDASIILPEATTDYIGVTRPALDQTSYGIAGEYSYGLIDLEQLGLGALEQENPVAMYGAFPEDIYFNAAFGFFSDCLMSHQFFRDYRWTIDFDSRIMTFSK